MVITAVGALITLGGLLYLLWEWLMTDDEQAEMRTRQMFEGNRTTSLRDELERLSGDNSTEDH